MRCLLIAATTLTLPLLLAPGSAPQPGRSEPPVADGLEARVTVTARGEPLEGLLRGLWADGRPRLEAAPEIAWERVNVFARERPLGDVVRGLSTLLGYRWEKRTISRGRSRYTLTPNLRTRQYEAELHRKTLERAAEPLVQLAAHTRTPVAEFERLEQTLQGREPDDPLLQGENLWRLSRPAMHDGLELFATLSPEQRWTLLAEERYLLPWTAMSSRQRELAQTVVAQLAAWQADPNVREPELKWLERFGLVLALNTHPATGAVTMYGAGASIQGGPLVCATFEGTARTLDLLPVRGSPYEGRAVPGASIDDEWEHLPFPAEFKLAPTKIYTWSEIVEKLAGCLLLPLFSDHYTALPDPGDRGEMQGPANLAKLSLAEGLDALCRQYGCLWWREGGALFLRSRDWFVERLYEVPPPVLTLLRHQLTTQGKLDLKAISALSQLSSRQLQGLSMATAFDRGGTDAERRWIDRDQARTAHAYLQTYRTLNEAQKRRVLDPQGLPLTQMSPQQQQAFLQMLFLEHGRQVLEQLSRLRLQVRQEEAVPSERSRSSWSVRLSLTYAEKAPWLASLQVSYQPKAPPADGR